MPSGELHCGGEKCPLDSHAEILLTLHLSRTCTPKTECWFSGRVSSRAARIGRPVPSFPNQEAASLECLGNTADFVSGRGSRAPAPGRVRGCGRRIGVSFHIYSCDCPAAHAHTREQPQQTESRPCPNGISFLAPRAVLPIDHARKCGYNEMDIMEMIDGDGTAWGTYWYWGNHSSPPRPHCIDGPPVRAGDAGVQVPDYYTAFHEYAIEWTPTSLKYIFDGSPYKSYTDPSMLPVNNHYWLLNSAVSTASRNPQTCPPIARAGHRRLCSALLLRCARLLLITCGDSTLFRAPSHGTLLVYKVGGTWPGSPNVQTVFPAYHHIDYVRVSQKKSY